MLVKSNIGFYGAVDVRKSVKGLNNASLTSIEAPYLFCPGNNNIDVRITNVGNNAITSLEIHWSMDGVIQTPFLYTNVLDTIDGAGNYSDVVTI